jgi:hypothetical protein
VIDRFANVISAGLHLVLILLAGSLTFEMQAPVPLEPGMEVEIIDMDYAMPKQDTPLAESDRQSPPNVMPNLSGAEQISAALVPSTVAASEKPTQPTPLVGTRAPVPQPAPAPSLVPVSAPRADDQPRATGTSSSTPVPLVAPRPVGGARLDVAKLSRSLNAESGSSQPTRLNTATIGSAVGKAVPRGTSGLTIRQRVDLAQKVREQVMPCWSPPEREGAGAAVVRLSFRLDRDGRVIGQPVQSGVTGQTASNPAYVKLLASSGRRAIMLCAPLRLPPELYSAWEEVEVEFDPRVLR